LIAVQSLREGREQVAVGVKSEGAELVGQLPHDQALPFRVAAVELLPVHIGPVHALVGPVPEHAFTEEIPAIDQQAGLELTHGSSVSGSLARYRGKRQIAQPRAGRHVPSERNLAYAGQRMSFALLGRLL